MNAFARSNLSVATLRLTEAREKARQLTNQAHRLDEHEVAARAMAIEWAMREAMRLIDAATAIDEMESTDTLPAAPDSNTRRIGS